jgi:hypothetical protein
MFFKRHRDPGCTLIDVCSLLIYFSIRVLNIKIIIIMK